MKELGGPLYKKQGHFMGLCLPREWIHSDKREAVSILVQWKWSHSINTPIHEGGAALVNPVELLP